MEWIDIKVEQPKDGSKVVCLTRNDNVLVFKTIINDWHVKKYNLTHWFYPTYPDNS